MEKLHLFLTYFLKLFLGNVLSIYVRSEGCEDRGRFRGCGRAYIKVNGKDYSRHGRGYNIVVLNSRGLCEKHLDVLITKMKLKLFCLNILHFCSLFFTTNQLNPIFFYGLFDCTLHLIHCPRIIEA